MKFEVIGKSKRTPTSGERIAYLEVDHWDDYSFQTLFDLVVFDGAGIRHQLGSVKIGFFGQEQGERVSERVPSFKKLDSNYFSLGQTANYYSRIHKLDSDLKKQLMEGLQDVVFNELDLEQLKKESVFKTSLLRMVSVSSINGQFRRVLDGADLLTEYHFQYSVPETRRSSAVTMEFSVEPESNPPSNVHVIIGRNGVGKTHLLNNMITSLVGDNYENKSQGTHGTFKSIAGKNPRRSSSESSDLFSGIVSVAFSAFDPFDPIPEKQDKSEGMRYAYVGLKRDSNRGGKKGSIKSHEMLTNEFVKSLQSCISLGKDERLLAAIEMLESDPLFKDINLYEIISSSDTEKMGSKARSLYKRLSSGHGAVLLTITKLVEKVEEKTLVIMDEPEGHLHPPLLSAFIRALSDLLSYRNGVAIIATHSPVIVQEVPANCVWKLWRSGHESKVARPEIETFGENIGILTREIFGYEVTKSGFHQLLIEAISESSSYRLALRKFEGRLGGEAKAIVRGLMEKKIRDQENEVE